MGVTQPVLVGRVGGSKALSLQSRLRKSPEGTSSPLPSPAPILREHRSLERGAGLGDGPRSLSPQISFKAALDHSLTVLIQQQASFGSGGLV